MLVQRYARKVVILPGKSLARPLTFSGSGRLKPRRDFVFRDNGVIDGDPAYDAQHS